MQYILGSLESTVNLRAFPDFYDNVDLDDLDTMSYLMKDDSLSTSLIIGIDNSGFTIEYESYLTVYLTFDYLTSDSLIIGDKILEINGLILREDEELTVHAVNNIIDDDSCSIGLSLAYFTELVTTEVDYEIIETNTGGPSGGLMQALFVYNQLIETDLTHGLKIAGTGTINLDGSVGYIGSIEQKIITADINNIDIFFVPHITDSHEDNYIEALKVYNTLDTDMILVGITSFQDAVDYLLAYESGDDGE